TTNSIAFIVEVVYPFVVNRPLGAKYFKERTILSHTLGVVEKVNDFIMSIVPGEKKGLLHFLIIVGINQDDEDLCYVEYLNSIKLPDIPNHCLRHKVGVLVMLLRNIDQSSELCNDTRLVVTRLI
ncbi:hypothetical protein V2J09_006452, partial [Rumex salicifolius]